MTSVACIGLEGIHSTLKLKDLMERARTFVTTSVVLFSICLHSQPFIPVDHKAEPASSALALLRTAARSRT